MLKRPIKYQDFEGNEVEEVFYFNLSKRELIEMEVEIQGGLGNFLKAIVEAQNHKELVNQFKTIILKSYGIKSPDGKSFVKNDEVREAFSHTAAYEQLFMELTFDDGAAAAFIKGVMPADLEEALTTAEKSLTQLPQPTPST